MPTFNVNIDSQLESLTKTALAGLIAGADLSLNKLYIVTDATAGDNKRIVVYPTSASSLSTVALNLSDDTFGNYDLGTDTFTAIDQTAVESVSGDGVDNTDPLNPVIDLADVATSGDYNDLNNLPTIPAAQIQSDWNQSNNALADFIKNKPSIPAAQIQSDWTQSNNAALDFIKNKPTLATVATSGAYSDLSGTPSLATVATSGSYADLLNKPKVSITLNAGGSNTTFQAGTTYYFSPSYAMATAFTNQQANFHKFVKGGTLKGFTYIWRTTQGNASLVITLQKGTASTNMADTAATLTVAANSAAGSSSSATDITVNDGDFVTIKAVQSAGGNAGTAAGFFTEFEQQL